MSEPTMQKPRVLMMAAGTGGHVFPAIAVAQALQQSGAQVHWLGTLVGMEMSCYNITTLPTMPSICRGYAVTVSNVYLKPRQPYLKQH